MCMDLYDLAIYYSINEMLKSTTYIMEFDSRFHKQERNIYKACMNPYRRYYLENTRALCLVHEYKPALV